MKVPLVRQLARLRVAGDASWPSIGWQNDRREASPGESFAVEQLTSPANHTNDAETQRGSTLTTYGPTAGNSPVDINVGVASESQQLPAVLLFPLAALSSIATAPMLD
jgi:hypothetical protein